jgi:hypothetical protein
VKTNASFAVLVALLVALPWLNPLAATPTSTVQPMLVYAASTALLLGLLALVRMPREVLWRGVCWGWLVAATVNAVFALLQYFDLAEALRPWVSEAPRGMGFGNVRQRNLFATLCAMGLAALAWNTVGLQAASAQGEGLTAMVPPWALKAGRAGVAALLGAGLVVSSSRTGMFELALLWILFGLWRFAAGPVAQRLAARWALAWGTAAYVLGTWLLPVLAGLEGSALSRLLAGDAVCSGRRVLWANVWQLVLQKPWLGWGGGELGYAHFMTLFDGPRFCGILGNAHNLPLQLAFTAGLPVAALVTGLVVLVVLRAQPWRAVAQGQQLAWAVLGLIGLHSLLEYPLWTGAFQFAVLVCGGYLYGCRGQAQAAVAWLHAPVLDGRGLRATALLLMCVVVSACALVADSYHRVSMLFVKPQQRPAQYVSGVPLQQRDVMLFVNEVSFTRLGTELTPETAQDSLDMATHLLHFNANYFAIERIMACLDLLGRHDEAHFYELRYAAAFPAEHARWVAAGRRATFFQYNLRW